MPDTFPGLFFGYTVIWLLLAYYIFSLGKKVKSLQAALESKQQNTEDESNSK